MTSYKNRSGYRNEIVFPDKGSLMKYEYDQETNTYDLAPPTKKNEQFHNIKFSPRFHYSDRDPAHPKVSRIYSCKHGIDCEIHDPETNELYVLTINLTTEDIKNLVEHLKNAE